MGTRPEAIKFAPLIKQLEKEPSFELRICITGQHKEMLQQVLDFFESCKCGQYLCENFTRG